jgi:hypothetical protein
MRQRLAPMLFDDTHKEEAEAQRRALRSQSCFSAPSPGSSPGACLRRDELGWQWQHLLVTRRRMRRRLSALAGSPRQRRRPVWRACSSALSTASKRFIPLTVLSSTRRGLVNRSRARTPAVAAEQDFAPVDQAVEVLLDGGEGVCRRSLPVFHLSVVLEKRHVAGPLSLVISSDQTSFGRTASNSGLV